MRFVFPTLILSSVCLVSCAHADWPPAKPGLYNWYTSDASQEVVQEHFDKASVKPLGSKTDTVEIKSTILTNREHVTTAVKEIRWISSTLVMAKAGIYGPNVGSSEYTFVLEKRPGAWTIIACYMDWIS